jgi:hypothetical protein
VHGHLDAVAEDEADFAVGPALADGCEFGFIAVNGWMDCRWSERDGLPFVEFTWEGNGGMDQACGRGWVVLAEDGTLTGHLFIHLGEDSGFRATPLAKAGKRSGR